MGLSRVSGSDGLPTNTAPTDGTLDEGELKLLVKVFGTMKSRRGRAYNYTTRDHVTHYRTSEYVMELLGSHLVS